MLSSDVNAFIVITCKPVPIIYCKELEVSVPGYEISTAYEQGTTIVPVKLYIKPVSASIWSVNVNSAGLPPTILALLVGTMIVRHAKVTPGVGHPD